MLFKFYFLLQELVCVPLFVGFSANPPIVDILANLRLKFFYIYALVLRGRT